MKKFIMLFFVSIVTACSSERGIESDMSDKIEAIEATAQRVETIATDMHIPWNITKHNNIFYLSQRAGSIIKVDDSNGEKIEQTLVLTKDVLHESEGGLLGFILAPDFNETHQAVAYHTYEQDEEIYNRVILLKLNQNTWKEEKILIEKLPGGRIHNGGRIKIGPDNKLYITVGDAGHPDNAQNLEILAGKILRMELDGSIPVDNPFNNSYVFSYGHRNPQGLAWDEAGNLYSSEHGQNAHDELNLILPGKNYGWPVIEGDEQLAGMVTPLFHTGFITWAPSGIEIKDKKVYVANLRGESIKVYNLRDGTVNTLFENAGRMRDVLIVGDRLYTITNNRDGRGKPQAHDDQLFKINLLNNQEIN